MGDDKKPDGPGEPFRESIIPREPSVPAKEIVAPIIPAEPAKRPEPAPTPPDK